MDTTQTIETLVVGGGQAGLATAYHLTREGRECLVLDGGDRVGDQWRGLWESLRLYSPARYDSLPGMPFPGDPWHFPDKDEVADYLEAYTRRFRLPVQTGVRVRRLWADGEDYLATTDIGEIRAHNVVVATGTFGRTPHVPDAAADLDPAIVQLHSSEYRGPDQFPAGRVLVVGASHSGFDIAWELAGDHQVVLAGRDCGQLPLRFDSRQVRAAFPVLWQVWGTVMNRRTPVGRKLRQESRSHGAPALRVKREHLDAAGVERVTKRVVGTHEGRPLLADDRVVDAVGVVWATGYRQAFDWIELDVLDEGGWPREQRGVVTEAPGLFFTGLCFQSSFRSMLIGGAGDDAAYVARQLRRRNGAVNRTAAAA